MFRYLCLMLILILSLGNVIRLGKRDQVDMYFWLSASLLLFSTLLIIISTLKTIRNVQLRQMSPKRIRLRDLKKYDEFW